MKKKDFLIKVSKELNSDLPKSEKWFNSELKKRDIDIPNLKPNFPFLGYIPDYICKELFLIIEIDGSIHNSEEQKIKDKKKDDKYKTKGYTVVRIEAYNQESLMMGLGIIHKLLKRYNRNIYTDPIKDCDRENKILLRKVKKNDTRIKSMCYVCSQYKGKHKLEFRDITVKLCGYCIKLNDPFKLLN